MPRGGYQDVRPPPVATVPLPAAGGRAGLAPQERPGTPVAVIAGDRSRAADRFFSPANFSKLAHLQLKRLPAVPMQSLAALPRGFDGRTIIVSAHSGHVDGLVRFLVEKQRWSADKAKAARDFLRRHGTVDRVFKWRKDDRYRPYSYLTPWEVAGNVALVATSLRAKSTTAGSNARPFRIFVASCHAGDENERGGVHHSIADAMSSLGFAFEVHASIGRLVEQGGAWTRTGFASQRDDGHDILEALLTGEPPPSYHWTTIRGQAAAATTQDVISGGSPGTARGGGTGQNPFSRRAGRSGGTGQRSSSAPAGRRGGTGGPPLSARAWR